MHHFLRLTILACVCFWIRAWFFEGGLTPCAAEEKEDAPPAYRTLFDADQQHLWNRLHRTLWMRTARDGKEYGHDRLDPYLWRETRHLLEGDSHDRAIAVLDEFLTSHGEKLVQDPLRRAILQRDLWAVFDWSTESREKNHQAASRALQLRLAKVIQRIALGEEQIKGLADNYAAAVKSQAFAEKYAADQPERAFLPPDLLQKDGPWVEIVTDNNSVSAASRHVFDFGARSAFRILLRLPEGRKETLDYLARLNAFPQPWLAGEDSKREPLRMSAELPQFPAGTQVALVRQMLLIDDTGEIAATGVTVSVQLRVFRSIPGLEVGQEPLRGRVHVRGEPETQHSYEITLSRAAFFAGKSGGLRAIARDEKDFRTQLLVNGLDEFEYAANDRPEKQMASTLQTCRGCHDRPGIYSLASYVGGFYPRPRYHLPQLSAGSGDEQAWGSALKKNDQYSWGLLRGIWSAHP